MKKTLIFEECSWILTNETRNDKTLNPVDMDILTALQFIKDGKDTYPDGYFALILKDGDNINTSLQGVLADFGLKVDYTTVSRSINKLQRFGYLEYRRGFYNNETKKGAYPKVKILKGTVDMNSSKSTNGISNSYSDIAIAQEKEKEKEKENNFTISDVTIGKNEIESVLDHLEWCISNDLFVCRAAFDRVFTNLKKEYPAIAIQEDYLMDKLDRQLDKFERNRLNSIA